ncbi:MAG: MmgE/PrpD family protein [Candidatus Helarchaeota archaeon]
METRAEKMADWILSVTYEKIPDEVIQVAKQQILGMFGACFAGSTTYAGKILLDTIKSYHSNPEATILPSGVKTSIFNALYTNAAFSMALDYDDYLLTTHTGTSAYSIPLALGEKFDISGKEYLTSVVIGNEIMGRVGLSIYPPGEGQQQSFIHAAGGAAIGAKLLGLSKDQIVNAFGIALYQAPITIPAGFFGPHSKLLTSSIPAKMGVEAAFLAKNGFTGAKTIFEDPQGFCKSFSEADYEKVLDNDLGRAWATLSLSKKIYPGCAYVDSIADAIFKIFKNVKKAGKTLDYKNIESVKVSNSLLSTMMDDMARPFTGLDELKRVKSSIALNFFQPYNVAVILIDQELTTAQLTLERMTDPEIFELAKKITFSPDIGISAKSGQVVPYGEISHPDFHLGQWDFKNWKMYCGCKVIIKMKDGTKWKAKVDIPVGAAGGEFYPMEKKFSREAELVGMPEAQIKKAIDLINNLENIQVRDLINALVIT